MFRSALFAVTVLALLSSVRSAQALPHIVLISIDTLRADHLSSYGYGEETSPFLTARAREAVLFERVLVPVPATTPSHASMLTGVHPFTHGAMSNAFRISPRVDTLASAMKRRGYTTVGAVSVFHLGREYGFAAGFDYYSEPLPGEVSAARTEARPGIITNAAMSALVDRALRASPGKPMFLFMHYFDLHAPYGWWRAGFVEPRTQAARIAEYDESIRHVDDLIKRFLGSLRAKGLEDVVVFVTSDHGEQIGERGLDAGHADIYRETTDVPLLVWGPDIRGGHVKTQISALDIGPAVAAVAGAKIRNVLPKENAIREALERGVLDRLAEVVTGEKEGSPVVVTGYPVYTRSLLLAEGSFRLVRNFDPVYRDVAISVAPVKREGTTRKPLSVRDDVARFAVEPTAYEPHVVTFDYYPRVPDCATTVSVTVDGSTPYFTTKVEARTAGTRLRFGAARLDQIDVWIRPARCVSTVFTSITRMESSDRLRENGNTIASSLYKNLMAQRKASVSDELYDLRVDPGMERNLIGDAAMRPIAASMQRTLRKLYTSFAAVRSLAAGHKYTSEEVKKLKSLGYIQ